MPEEWDGAARELEWDGAVNARDLGGLPATGGPIQYGRVFRSAHPDALTEAGRDALLAAGIRTIVDLRNADERLAVRDIPGVEVHHHPVEDQSDAAFMAEWGERLNTPAYYNAVLHRWPGLVTAVFARLADAPPGGVVIHCRAGCDRTGMITAMLLSLAGTPVADILDDYELALRTYAAGADDRPLPDQTLDQHCAQACADLVGFLGSVDVPGFLTSAGLTFEQLDRVRERLVATDFA
ncbi:tyrosine-protein phosphatase [Kribbella sp. NPDC051770]|uniref:tyrosine-protein phosphatase n=1 Tax=Kribbella sp. NPDC051770 TaxID=3155413 RepID=UPI00343C369C